MDGFVRIGVITAMVILIIFVIYTTGILESQQPIDDI